MAYLYRLIALLSLVFLLSPTANAQTETIAATATTTPNRTMWRVQSQTHGTKFYLSALQSCQWVLGVDRGWAAGSVYLQTINSEQYGCRATVPPAPFVADFAFSDRFTACVADGATSLGTCEVTYSCPSGYTLQGTSCVRTLCPGGTYVQPGQQCPAQNLCTALATANTPAGEYSGVGSVGTYKVCDSTGISVSGDPALPGCVVSVEANFAVTVAGLKKWVGLGKFTGAKCSGDPTAPPDSDGANAPATSPTNGAPAPCPPPKVPGTINGTTVCVDAGPTDATEKKGTTSSTTTNPDGSTTQTTNNTTTTCSGAGSCTTTTTTTTTTTPAGGGTPTTSTTANTTTCTVGQPGCGDEDEDERSSFSGSCGAAFSCDGDAIFCAVAQEQHKRNCQLFVDQSTESQLYETEKGKTGVQYQNENVPISPSSFSQSNSLGASAQCISDRTVTVWDQSVTLPFSQVCNTLQHLGTVLIFLSFLISYRIVSRG